MSKVTFAAETGQSVTVLMDAAHPLVTNGYGGWESVDRPKRPSITRFKGRAQFKQDFSILFDGYVDGQSQEEDIHKLEAMATQSGDLQRPPRLKVSGMAYKTNLWWVIDNIDWDNQTVIAVDIGDKTVRLRQAAVVHLIEFIDDTVIFTPAQPTVSVTKPVKKIITPDGMTLKQIANQIYGDPDKWFIIYQANPLVIAYPDPRQFIPKGTPLLTPGGHVPTFTVP